MIVGIHRFDSTNSAAVLAVAAAAAAVGVEALYLPAFVAAFTSSRYFTHKNETEIWCFMRHRPVRS